jgi:hypothetical protein
MRLSSGLEIITAKVLRYAYGVLLNIKLKNMERKLKTKPEAFSIRDEAVKVLTNHKSTISNDDFELVRVDANTQILVKKGCNIEEKIEKFKKNREEQWKHL